MFRLFVALSGVLVFISSALVQTAMAEETVPVPALIIVHSTKLFTTSMDATISTDTIIFPEDGATFIAGSKFNGIGLFRTSDYGLMERYYAPTGNDILDSTPTAVTSGIGYINNNTWYFAARAWGGGGKPIVANIRTIHPPQEIATYLFEDGTSFEQVIANETHIGHGDKMINWRDGKSYRVKTIHPAIHRYDLTRSSRVLTGSFWVDGTLIDDPVNGKTEYLEHEIILSPDERHAVMWSGKRCRLLQWPERKEIGTCGRLPLFFGTDRYRAVFAPDGKSFVSWIDGKARVYRTDPFRLTSEFALSRGIVDALVLSNDGWLASVDGERRFLQLWDGATGKLAGQYQYQTSVEALAFQPHGDRLLVSESDNLKVFALPERAAP